ncbi:MAG TPA: PPOX class F420-dependent oxidoreductase [Streptosporangiaceae bacterium]|jgi:PPOX class probable F420-dependent enzyme
MSPEQAQQFVRDHHRAVLATIRSDGLPQLSPVSCAVDDDGRVLISTREPAIKTRNLRRNPFASVCAFTDGFFGPWVQAEGTAEIIALPEAMDLLVDYYRRVSGEHPDWDDYRAAMERDQRVMIRITISRAGPSVSG